MRCKDKFPCVKLRSPAVRLGFFVSHDELVSADGVTYYSGLMDIDPIGFLPALLPVALSPGASFTLALNSALTG
ncbi:hypothetical protein GCM10007905_34370 [Mixta theicola]|nr:hypothetical protein GCM10007905_34370 [Mixta theicola]